MATQYYQIQDFSKHLKNPEKYKGQYPITLRSSWEIKFSIWLDANPSVIEWSSESIIIPYVSPADNRKHRYFVDFWMMVAEKPSGRIKEYLIEIKPYGQTIPPKKPARMTKRYVGQVAEYLKNQAKWKAAREFCDRCQIENGKDICFVVLTEKDLPV